MNAYSEGYTIDARVATEGPDGNLDLQYFGEIAISPNVKALFQGEKETYYYRAGTPSMLGPIVLYLWATEG